MTNSATQEVSDFRRWWESPSVRKVRRRISDLQALLYPLLAGAVFLWLWSVRRFVKYDRRGPLYDYIREGKPFILTNWHEDSAMMTVEASRFAPIHRTIAMGSPGRIGKSAAYVFRRYGLEIIHGSNSLRGIEAINEISEIANERGCSILLTADGSRGPHRVAAWGATYLAKNTQLPLIVGRGWQQYRYTLKNTWMKLALPLPWGRGLFLSSEPMFVREDATKEELREFRRKLEGLLNETADASVAYFEEGPESVEAWPKTDFAY